MAKGGKGDAGDFVKGMLLGAGIELVLTFVASRVFSKITGGP
jgi:hypothetical protein